MFCTRNLSECSPHPSVRIVANYVTNKKYSSHKYLLDRVIDMHTVRRERGPVKLLSSVVLTKDGDTACQHQIATLVKVNTTLTRLQNVFSHMCYVLIMLSRKMEAVSSTTLSVVSHLLATIDISVLHGFSCGHAFTLHRISYFN